MTNDNLVQRRRAKKRIWTKQRERETRQWRESQREKNLMRKIGIVGASSIVQKLFVS